MRLKTYVKHCIMQWPTIFRNATEVYNHLFYVIGNGYHWEDGVLKEPGFKIKSKQQCIKELFEENVNDCYEHIKRWDDEHFEDKIGKELQEKLIISKYKHCAERILEGIRTIEHAEELADDFSIPSGVFPYTSPKFKFEFYPIYDSSACMNIPDDVQPDWLEGIEKINKVREEYEKQQNNDTAHN